MFSGGIKNIFYTVTYPAQKILATTAQKISGFGDTISSIGKLQKENETLFKENIKLQSEIAKLKNVATENEYLRRELKLLPMKKFDLISAQIVGREIYKNSDWILIDKGGSDNLKVGMPVIVENGVLVGKVDEVYPHNSKIILLTNSKSKINAVTSETEAKGIVKSEYGLGVVLDMVLQTDYLKIGDTVVTSNISQTIPGGLLIGKIAEVQTSEDQLFQRAILSLPINFSKLRFVFVIKN